MLKKSTKNNTKLKVISLFSGAGGMDIGFEDAGFKIKVAVESDPACCQTLKVNLPKLKIIQDLIENVPSTEILRKAGLKPLETALVIGGPPCQPFSLAGKRGGLNDAKGHLFKEFARVVRDTLPVGFVLENVKGLVNWDHGRAKAALIEEFTKPVSYKGKTYQYKVKLEILNAKDFGVPQNRERMFLVGNRVDVDFQFPTRTHGDELTLLEPDLKPYITVCEAISKLPEPDKPSETAIRVAGTISQRRIAY